MNKAVVLKFLSQEKEANELFHSVNLDQLYFNEYQRQII